MVRSYIFIVGVSRTGSKMYRYLINNNSEIAIAPEIKFMIPYDFDIVDLIGKIGDMKNNSNVIKLIDALWDGHIESTFWEQIKINQIKISKKEFLKNVINSDRSNKAIFTTIIDMYTESVNKKRGGAKFPIHISYAPMLLKWFPTSKIIHITRDPRAVIASHSIAHGDYVRKKIPIHFPKFIIRNFLLLHGVYDYISASKVHCKMQHMDNYYLSRFEEFMDQPEFYVRRLCDFLEIDFTEEMLYPKAIDSSYNNFIKKKLDRKAIDRWKKHLSPFNKMWISILTRRSMKRFGYNP